MTTVVLKAMTKLLNKTPWQVQSLTNEYVVIFECVYAWQDADSVLDLCGGTGGVHQQQPDGNDGDDQDNGQYDIDTNPGEVLRMSLSS